MSGTEGSARSAAGEERCDVRDLWQGRRSQASRPGQDKIPSLPEVREGKQINEEIDSLGEAVEESEKVLTMRIKSLEAENKELLRQCEASRKITEDRGEVVEALRKEKSALQKEIKRLKEYEGKTCLDCQKEHEKSLTAEEAKKIIIKLSKLQGKKNQPIDPMGFGLMRNNAINECIKIVQEAFKKKGVDL